MARVSDHGSGGGGMGVYSSSVENLKWTGTDNRYSGAEEGNF